MASASRPAPHCRSSWPLTHDMKAKELVMSLAWWSEHPSELPLLLLTAIVTHLLMSFSQNPDALWPRPSAAGRDILPKSPRFSSCPLFERPLGIAGVYQKRWRWQQHAILSDPCSTDARSDILNIPLGVFLVQIITACASFSAHVYLDNQYHIAESRLLRFAWFRRKQQLHFVHHRYANSNLAIIDNF